MPFSALPPAFAGASFAGTNGGLAECGVDMRFLAAGDTAVVVELGETIDRALNDRVLALAHEVRLAPPAGVVEVVPTFRSLTVHYDPLVTSGEAVIDAIRGLTGVPAATARRRLWRIPACYAPAFAIDLAEVAGRTGWSGEEIVAQHVVTRFHVYMIGFSPGHPYMGDLPVELALPRRTEPRIRVPRGGIGIAGRLSVIYPADSPSGWHLIGATPIDLFNPTWAQPSLLAPGDAVQFDPIDAEEFESIRAAVVAGDYVPAGEVLSS